MAPGAPGPDRRPRRPWLLALVALGLWLPLRFPGALPGPAVVSADDHLTVHPAFQTAPGGRVRHPQLSDPALQLAALDRQTVAALRAGQAPLWNPDIYGGAPLLADAQSRPGAPVTWLKALLPDHPALAQDLGVAGLLLAFGAGSLALAAQLGLGPLAALGAGLASLASPYLSVWLLHPHASTLVWLPWVLLAVERRHPVALALAVAGLCGGGHPGTLVHALGIALGWGLLRARAPVLLLGALAGGLLAAPLLLPIAENGLQSTTFGARIGGRLAPAQLADLLWPGAWGHPATTGHRGPGAWADGQLHPGLATLALALWGARRHRIARGLWGAFALLVLASLVGLPGPFAHGRLASLGAWLLCLAAGFGIAALPGRRLPALALVAVVATGIHARWHDQGSLPAEAHQPAPAPWTTALRAAVSAGPAGPGRVLGLGWMLQPNTGALAGLRDLRGYDLPVSATTHRLMAALASPPRGPWYPVERLPPRSLLDFAAVRALVTAPEARDEGAADPTAGLAPLDVGPAPVAVHLLDATAPRAWLATGWQAVPDATAGLQALVRAPAAPRARPPVEGLGPGPAGGTVHPVQLTERGGAALDLRLAPADRPAAPALVVVADAWAPGWRARVDGAPAPVLRVGGVFRGIPVPAGAREIHHYYRPDGWIWGQRAAVAGLALLLALAAGRAWRRRIARTGTAE